MHIEDSAQTRQNNYSQNIHLQFVMQNSFLVKCHGQDKLIAWRTYFKKKKHFYTECQKLMLVNG